jgi:hypothetical protein
MKRVGYKQEGMGFKRPSRNPKDKCLTRKDKAAIVLGFSSVCEGYANRFYALSDEKPRLEVYRGVR